MGVDPTLTFKLYNEEMYYFYVIQDELLNLYFGSTDNLKRRLKEHQTGLSVYTKRSKSWHLVYYEAFYSESDAREREQKVKNNTGTKKHLLKRIQRSRQFGSKGRDVF